MERNSLSLPFFKSRGALSAFLREASIPYFVYKGVASLNKAAFSSISLGLIGIVFRSLLEKIFI